MSISEKHENHLTAVVPEGNDNQYGGKRTLSSHLCDGQAVENHNLGQIANSKFLTWCRRTLAIRRT